MILQTYWVLWSEQDAWFPLWCMVLPHSYTSFSRSKQRGMMTSSLLPEVKHTSANLTSHFPQRWGRKLPTWLFCLYFLSQYWRNPSWKDPLQPHITASVEHEKVHNDGDTDVPISWYRRSRILTKSNIRRGIKNGHLRMRDTKQEWGDTPRARLFSTELVVKWSLLSKNIVNSTRFQDAVGEINKTDIPLGTRHRLNWLRKTGNQ